MNTERANSQRDYGTTNTCPTGKLAYGTRRAAKAALRHFQGCDGHLRPYLHQQCGFYHLGHLPQAVLAGKRTADQIYGTTTGSERVGDR